MKQVKIKICGITTEEDVKWINQYQPEYAGFVYYPKSRRHISLDRMKQLMRLTVPEIRKVAVCVEPSAEEVKALEACGADLIQIHGRLDPDLPEAAHVPLWHAVNIQPEIDRIPDPDPKISGYVADGSRYGGGKTFDWKDNAGIFDRFRRNFREQRPEEKEPELILAGGLNPSNVTAGIRMFHPDIVDVSSGVESPGRPGKDPELIRQFIHTVRTLNQKGSTMKKSSMREHAYIGEFGGQYVAETLMNTLEELNDAFEEAIHDPEFMKEYHYYLDEYVGRATPLYYAERLSEKYGTKIYLKREDLDHTGAHKINNVIGQILLAKRMGKTKVIAETGAGQHGVATATGAALFNMKCTVYMGKEDMERQALNVFRMRLLGADVVSVESGSNTLKDATNEAIRTWAKTAEDTFYIIGSAVGPYPYPKMVKEFQRVISTEARAQHLEKEGRLPDVVMACVGGGSNSIGMFADFIDDRDVHLIGVEAAGRGIETGEHAAAFADGTPGTLHGMRSYLLQDEDGNIKLAHSISAGLDYPGVGPEHAYLRDSGRAQYVSITDAEAMDALMELTRVEGIIPAIESAHAMAYAFKKAKEMTMDQSMIVCLSGRGDKDINTIVNYVEGKGYQN